MSEASVNRIDGIFAELRESNRRALMPFVCGGHPSLGATEAMLPAIAEAGGSIIEVGVPFSDPIADGPVIASAMHETLQAGVTLSALFERIARVRERTDAGLVAMASVSLAHACGGAGDFATRVRDAGFDGLIVPDVPLEECGELREAAGAAGLTLSLLVAPTTPPPRAAEIAKACTGFVYLLARSGVTGEQKKPPKIAETVARLRDATDLPIACGFGISDAEQVRAVTADADAAIVGSALVRRLSEAGADRAAKVAADFTRELARGLTAAAPGDQASEAVG